MRITQMRFRIFYYNGGTETHEDITGIYELITFITNKCNAHEVLEVTGIKVIF